MKKLLTIMLVMALAILALTGCAKPVTSTVIGGADEPTAIFVDDGAKAEPGAEAEPAAQAAADGSLDAILEKGYFVLGLDDSFPPMGYKDENGDIVGYDIDLATQVCARLGVELRLQPIDWAAKEIELSTGAIDCIWNGMTITQARIDSMSMSVPYMNNSQAVVVLAQSDIVAKADLGGKIVGIQEGSSAVDAVESEPEVLATFGELVRMKDNMMAIQELKLGLIDAVVADEVLINYYTSSEPDSYRLLEENFGTEQYGIGFRKSDVKLCQEVNRILGEMKADGELAQISQKWFGRDVSIIE